MNLLQFASEIFSMICIWQKGLLYIECKEFLSPVSQLVQGQKEVLSVDIADTWIILVHK